MHPQPFTDQPSASKSKGSKLTAQHMMIDTLVHMVQTGRDPVKMPARLSNLVHEY